LLVLKKHKKAIGWTLADILGISPSTCMHMILLEDGAKPVRQPQRRLNPIILDVVKKEVTKLLQARIIYPISDSQWVSPIQVVPKKTGLTMIKNERDELIPTRVQNSWQVCIDYRRLNLVTRKDHFPLPFIDQMLERLAGKSHYCRTKDQAECFDDAKGLHESYASQRITQDKAIRDCHTLISSGDLCLMTCDFSLVLVRCLAPIIRQFVKFRDMPKNKRKY